MLKRAEWQHLRHHRQSVFVTNVSGPRHMRSFGDTQLVGRDLLQIQAVLFGWFRSWDPFFLLPGGTVGSGLRTLGL